MTKKRYKKKKARPHDGSTDSHHLCWPRRDWNKGAAKKLRAHHYCIVRIPKRSLHQRIHNESPVVPVPKKLNVDSALFQLALLERFGGIRYDDPIEKRLRVLAAIFDCSEQPTADAFREQLEVVRKFDGKPSK